MQVAELDEKIKSADPVVLVVDDESDMIDMFRDVVQPAIKCKLHVASTMAEARRVLTRQPIELLVADINLPDGSGVELLEELKLASPSAAAIFMTNKPSVDHTIFAIRHGVLDYLPKPFSAEQIQKHVRDALAKQSIMARNEKRLTRLKTAVRELNKARHTVSQKVDILCNDLVHAYGEIAAQLNDVRSGESFRKTVESAADLEQMLCHAMDWLLKEAGYSNIAIWLAGDDQQYELGAYMKYTLAGEKKVIEALKGSLLQPTIREGFVHLTDQEYNQMLQPPERKVLPAQTIMSSACTYLGEALAVVMLFRDGKCPFRDEDETMLKTIASVFATSLATMVRGEPKPHHDDEIDPSGDIWEADEEKKPKFKKKPKEKEKNDADWWKRGEPPPF